jgi:putative NADH-flavin reductase
MIQMKVLVFGASGSTGHNLVSQALEKGHHVRAFVRDPSKLKIEHKNLNAFQGDVSNYKQVEDAVNDQDAVISALGASTPLKRNFILIKGIENIVEAMTKFHVERLVYQSFLGVKENRKELGFLLDRIVPILLKSAIQDHEVKENIITSSKLQWTIVRCPTLTNGPHTGKYIHGERIQSASFLPSLSRADVADFMLKELQEKKYIEKKPRIMKR